LTQLFWTLQKSLCDLNLETSFKLVKMYNTMCVDLYTFILITLLISAVIQSFVIVTLLKLMLNFMSVNY